MNVKTTVMTVTTMLFATIHTEVLTVRVKMVLLVMANIALVSVRLLHNYYYNNSN